ncbi:MAG: hypothetical protein A2Z20_05850 [Bdellovibrionales bacterium RBG_16_40_8]|nr:MAG: hypothetical protein A2Z20_05850 [Bdellovibrionales bacterium RBG_16_40_8]
MPSWRYLLLIIILSSQSISTWAKDITVFDVRRPLAMENNEVAPKDYYISAGEKDGLRKNMIVSVLRRQSLYDQYQNKSLGDLVVAVGQLRIIHVQPDISVARLEKIVDSESRPVIDFDAIMVGDKVDLNSAKMSSNKNASLGAEKPVNVPGQEETPILYVEIAPAPVAAPKDERKDFSSVTPQPPVSVGTSM